MLAVDTETLGFTGPLTLIQYQEVGTETPVIFEAFMESIDKNIALCERVADEGIIGFNLAFDWYQLYKWYTMMLLLRDEVSPNALPANHIRTLAELEPEARFGPCLKPRYALDLMLHARKTVYQSTMQRSPIFIRRVPRDIAYDLKKYLMENIDLPEICFAKAKGKDRWGYKPSTIDGKASNDFVDMYLNFMPSSSLKAIVIDAGLRTEDRIKYEEVQAPKPVEVSYAPFATAISKAPLWIAKIGKDKKKFGKTWPGLVEDHIVHWRMSEPRRYAIEDVEDTLNLYYHFDEPEINDRDSEISCMLGAIRWRGYPIDVAKAKALRDQEKQLIHSAPRSTDRVYEWLAPVLSENERHHLHNEHTQSKETSRAKLELLMTFKKECDCPATTEMREIEDPDLGTVLTPTVVKDHVPDCPEEFEHPVVERAKAVLKARQAQTKVALLDKLILAGRMHVGASTIGSLSGRVSGSSLDDKGDRVTSINALGIQRGEDVRSIFLFAGEDETFSSGDFDAFEIGISDAAWNDKALRKQLLTCSKCGYVHSAAEYRVMTACCSCKAKGALRKIHALFAMSLFPGNSYDDIIASKGSDNDMYDKGKRGVFGGLTYGGDERTLERRIGIPLEQAKKARDAFFNQFTGVQAQQNSVYEDFCSMRQERAHGKVSWYEPKNEVSSLLGFKRYFTLENQICKALYNLANDPPSEWQKHKRIVKRREDREQKAIHATQSALFGSAFNIQSGVYRAALNHQIQSTGADLIKILQRDIWNLQPVGTHEWLVAPFSIHDEIDTPIRKGYEAQVKKIVDDFVIQYAELIPLLRIEWKENLEDWSQK
ncbi:MAG: hypothetical protein CL489_06440 [Acidobacteria bacterium]|nr:hypothetical protein [Acidobacteriota bacterium]|tara:strand:+ start:62526 stop:65000 length:2475 start_codon:yes stop_codon:yes gene_type:complete